MISRCSLDSGRNAEAAFFGVTLGVEARRWAEDFVTEVGGPEQAALVGVVVPVGLVEDDRLGAPRGCASHRLRARRSPHGVVQIAQALVILGIRALFLFRVVLNVLVLLRGVDLVNRPTQTSVP